MPSGEAPKPLGEVLKTVIDQMGLRPRLNRAQVVEAWAALAGPQINGVTTAAWVSGRTLYVKVRSAAWRQELHMRRRQWLRRLNDELGRDLIDEIVFR